MKSLTLLQPRHIYAPETSIEKIGHIYIPTSLLTVASILINAKIDISLLDENLENFSITNNFIGVNLLGSPYIPYAVNLSKKMEKIFGKNNYKLILGGQVISGLTEKEKKILFGIDSIDGNNFDFLSKYYKIDAQKIINPQKVSLIDGYLKIKPENLKLYLKNEIGFYLSQGCKYSCSFCGAKRSRLNPIDNSFIKCQESYRDIDTALIDLEFLLKKAIDFDIKKLKIYLSNLDLFQSPFLLYEFASKLLSIESKYKEINICFRGLSNVRSFLKVHKNNPEIILCLVKAGLKRIGFGIDGSSSKIWKSTSKPQTKIECIDAVKIANTIYGITPEILMVFGYNKVDNEESLKMSFDFVMDMVDHYEANPRPHVAKEIIPCSNYWYNEENKEIVEKLIKYPDLFQNLDFTAIPSEITHKNSELRSLVTKYYIQMCELPSSLTQYVKPIGIGISESEIDEIKNFNQGRYDF